MLSTRSVSINYYLSRPTSPQEFLAVPPACSGSLLTAAGYICVFVFEIPKTKILHGSLDLERNLLAFESGTNFSTYYTLSKFVQKNPRVLSQSSSSPASMYKVAGSTLATIGVASFTRHDKATERSRVFHTQR